MATSIAFLIAACHFCRPDDLSEPQRCHCCQRVPRQRQRCLAPASEVIGVPTADAAAWLVNEVALDTLADQLDLPLDKVDAAVQVFVSASKNNEDAAAATKAAMDCGDDSDDELT